VVAEIAIVLVLMAGASVLVRDLWQRSSVDLGYEPEGLLTMNVSLAHERYREGDSRRQLVARSLAELRALPGVRAAGVSNIFPAEGQGNVFVRVVVEGADELREQTTLLNYRMVSPGFVEALGLTILGGRGISTEDRDGSVPVAVLNSAAVRRLFPDGDALGQRVQVVRESGREWLTVVGVVSDNVEFYDADETVFVAYDQNATSRQAAQLVYAMRTVVDPGALVAALREAIWSVDPDLAVFDVATASELYANALGEARSAGTLTFLCAAVGLIVALVGVYGSMAFSVGQRRREIAIRMALGAMRTRVLALLLGGAARTMAAGIGLGVAGAAILGRWLVSALPGIDTSLAWVLLTVSAALALACVGSAVLPALRALRVPAAEVLRGE
jgi:predicted permease